jgi:hypothetical protein
MNCCVAIYVSHCSGSRDPEVTRQELLRIHELGRNANLATLDSLGMLVIHPPTLYQPITASQGNIYISSYIRFVILLYNVCFPPSQFIVFTKRQLFCQIFKLGYKHSIESGRKKVYNAQFSATGFLKPSLFGYYYGLQLKG